MRPPCGAPGYPNLNSLNYFGAIFSGGAAFALAAGPVPLGPGAACGDVGGGSVVDGRVLAGSEVGPGVAGGVLAGGGAARAGVAASRAASTIRTIGVSSYRAA
jgi:hypothetical protein